MALKPFLKSSLPVVSIVLVTFTVLAVTTVFLSATSLVSNIGVSISKTVKWELAGSKYSSYESPRVISEPGNLSEGYVSVNEGFEISREVAERLSSDSRISDYVVVQIILVKTSEKSLIPLTLVSIIVLHGVKLSDLGVSRDAAIDSVVVDYLNTTLYLNNTQISLLNLFLGGLNYTTYSGDLSNLLEGLRGISCLELYETQFYHECVAYNPLSLLKASIVFDSSTFEEAGLSYLSKVKDGFRAVNVSVDFYTLNVLAFVDLRSESYFNPASIQGSSENAKAIAEDLKNSLNFAIFSNAPLRSVLSNYQVIETAFRVSSVAGVLPAFVALVVVLRPISEMLVLSVRRVFGLMRVRGVSQAVIRRWFYSILLLSLIAGFGLGLLASYVLAVSYFRVYNPLQALLDPVILSMLAILLAVEVIILARRISRISSSIPPSETLKTTLIPESLLEPVRMGGSGWFSVGVGLYFIITGITNYSATRILTTGIAGGLGGVNVALIIVLAIVAVFESLLKPFAPAIAVYGFVKLYIVNHEKFWDILHRSVLSRSSLALPSKSIALTIRRRVTPILVLLAFSTSVMTQTLIYSESMNFLVDSATKASVGSNFLLSKSLSINLAPNKTLREVLNEYPDTQKILNGGGSNNSSSVLAFPVQGSLGSGTTTYYCCLLTLVVVPDPNTFLKNTYWYDEWSLRGSFSKSLSEVLSEGKVVLVREPTYTMQTGVDLKNLSVSLTTSKHDVVLTPEVVDVWLGFPGIPSVSSGAFVLVAGSWVLDVPNFTKTLVTYSTGGSEVFTAHVYAYSLSNSVAEGLIDDGFTVVRSLDDLRSSPEVEIAKSLLTSAGGSSETYLIFMILSAGIAAVVAYVVALETGRTALLLRVRGLTPSKTLKLNALYWLTVIATSAILGSVVGLALGLSDLNAYGTPGGLGASLMYMFSYLLSLKGLQLGLGVLRVTIPPVLILTTLLAFALLSLIPIITIQLVYRGQVRERFIEVR
jgi:hypothetical protein